MRAIARLLPVAIVIVIVAVGSVGAVLYLQTKTAPTTTSTTSIGTTTSSSQSVSASSSSTSSATGGQVSLTVTKAIADPAESTSGVLVYIYNFAVLDQSVANLDVNTLDLQLVGSSNTVYHSSGGGASQIFSIDIFQPVLLNPKQQAKGQVAFSVPRTDTPSKLEFLSGSIDVSVGVPAPSANVSWIQQLDSNVTGSGSNAVSLNSLSSENFTAMATLGYYYSGDVIALKLSFGYFPSYSGPTTFQVTSISDSAGFKVVGISPVLPFGVGSSGADVMVYLLAPDTSFKGTLTIDISVN